MFRVIFKNLFVVKMFFFIFSDVLFLFVKFVLKKYITFFKKRKTGEIFWDEELGILVVGCNANKDATTTHNVELIASWPVIASNRCQSCIGVYKLRRSSLRHDVWTRQK